MRNTPQSDDAPRWADNSNGWPALAAMLTPSAGCDCQMIALTIADGFAAAPGPGPSAGAEPGKRPRR